MNAKRIVATSAAVMLLGPAILLADSGVIWWEGENAKQTNFPDRSWFTPANAAERDKLSGGEWLSAEGRRDKALFATYEIRVTKTGAYDFWVRKFWKHGPFRWRFGEGKWRTCGRDITLADNVVLRKHLCANWVFLGRVDLKAGRRTLRIELLENEGAAAFDCFVLTAAPFTPRGKLKPSQKYNRAPAGWFAFEPGVDRFGEAALDLRFLNHRFAGEKGFLQSRGMQFVFEKDDTPVKFWAVNAHPMASRQADVYFAKRLAKLGVNMVRIHGPIFDRSAADPATIDRKHLDRLHRFIAALKAEGIYTHLSFYFPLWFEIKPSYGVGGYESLGNKKPFGLLFFHPRMQAIYKSWARGLLLTVNPYTRLPLAKDPAVGIVEIINEDNYFFWTMDPYKNVPAPAVAILEKRFGDWLAKKYGAVDKALAKWGGGKVRGDDPAAGRAGLLGPWFYTEAARGRQSERRIGDQLQFLTEDLRTFYRDMHQWYRKEIGLRCPIVATNWKTADARLLGALDKYTNAVCETMDRHAYFGGLHKGDGASYSLRKGHRYRDASTLWNPIAAPVRELQYIGHTHIVTEYNWPMPNRYRGESVLLAAAYGSLQGTDGYFHFATRSASWEAQHPKFSIHTPAVMGQFPAAALLYRRGYVKEAPVVVHEAARLKDLYDRKGTAIALPQDLDILRKAEAPKGAGGEVRHLGSIDPLAYYVGQVTRTVAEQPGKSVLQDLSPYVDREKKTVASITGELLWDFGRGVVTIDSARAQGATGFLKRRGAIRLKDVVIQLQNEYGSVLVVSLDGEPIRSSAKLLLQVMTEDNNFGWKTTGGEPRTIADLGAPPIVVRKPSGTVTLNRPDAGSLQIEALDGHGYTREKLSAAGGGSGTVRVELLPDCLYYLIRK